MQRQDGKWLQVTDQRLPDGGMISFALDITERKKTEMALLESEHRFRDFASASAEWYWETDAQGRYTWISESLETISGQPIIGVGCSNSGESTVSLPGSITPATDPVIAPPSCGAQSMRSARAIWRR